MKLHEIIALNEDHEKSFLTSRIEPYKKSLYTYYKSLFCCEPIVMITSVFNTCSYCKIVPSNEFKDAIYAYLQVPYIVEDEEEEGYNEDLFYEYETICAYSKFLSELLEN